MQKIATIVIAGFLVIGCRGSRISKQDPVLGQESTNGTEIQESYNEIGFNITRADIRIDSEEGETEIIANIKYRKPGKFLLSVRNKAGLEAVRIFITADTILVSDRLARKTYYGSNEALVEKYGLAISELPGLFGFIKDEDISKFNETPCIRGNKNIIKEDEYRIANYKIDCRYRRMVNLNILRKSDGKILNIEYKGEVGLGTISLPAEIVINNDYNKEIIKVVVKKVQTENLEDFSFSESKNYERIEIK